jgi:hypothetical protein
MDKSRLGSRLSVATLQNSEEEGPIREKLYCRILKTIFKTIRTGNMYES